MCVCGSEYVSVWSYSCVCIMQWNQIDLKTKLWTLQLKHALLQVKKVCDKESINVKPKVLLDVEQHLVGGTYTERCKTRLYWPVSTGVTAWQYPLLKCVEKTDV